MKTNNLISLLAAGLVLTLTVTGCHKRPNSMTTITGTAHAPQDQGMNGLPPAQPIPDSDSTTGSTVPTTSLEEFEGMIADRAALAANTVHFDYDSAAIKKSEKINVEAAVASLRLDANTKLLVEGHCDERGTEEYNRALGERRALALREALAKLGIDPARIRTLSFGEDRPAAPGHDESAWHQNRRGEFVLLHPKQ